MIYCRSRHLSDVHQVFVTDLHGQVPRISSRETRNGDRSVYQSARFSDGIAKHIKLKGEKHVRVPVLQTRYNICPYIVLALVTYVPGYACYYYKTIKVPTYQVQLEHFRRCWSCHMRQGLFWHSRNRQLGMYNTRYMESVSDGGLDHGIPTKRPSVATERQRPSRSSPKTVSSPVASHRLHR